MPLKLSNHFLKCEQVFLINKVLKEHVWITFHSEFNKEIRNYFFLKEN